ncbi:hypothetical protein B7P43_G02352 [Cryptotermes secundus]|uniref:inositol-polyphosphate 5-phosphatase n=5 Tax=Cryptotermes secundus TaxID=105785 RepID=A0A2J7RB37_9NEOP|nr:uncharacterized protein LOC111862288 isoform X3 [Cryptotermes secundus]PNF38049.1 hypothetical protein B7P43_G02352 [Cryptotermes secundus]
MSSEELRLFDKVRVYLDEDYSSAENFTALGNFYFIHESLTDVLIWDFSAMSFVPAKGKEVHSGNIEAVSTKEKSKFPQNFFPECKWSRKGFLRTRWSLCGSVFDLINIHLFHDASNFIAMESFPSVYCKNRRRALEHTLDRFHNDDYGTAPFFVFGDFNFRTDTQGVVKKLAEGLNPVRLQSNKSTDHTKLQYRDGISQVILSVGKKEFSHQNHQTVFIEENGKWLKEFDRELEPFADRLYEFPITFQPSYPFEEDRKGAKCYMQTRCPSWCDRILLSKSAKSLVSNVDEPGSVQYGLMGTSTCMGDHKPVYLKVSLKSDAGMIPCDCSSESSPCFGLSLPVDARVSPPQWPKSRSQHGSRLDPAALSSMLLAARCTTVSPVATGSDSHLLLPPSAHASLLHDPYTPESMETPSSSPTPSIISQFEFPDECERKNDTDLMLYESVPQSTEDKVCSWNFVVDTVERPDGPDEEECGGDQNECSNEIRKIMRPDIQEIYEYYSGPQNETLLLTEKYPSGGYRRIAFTSSGMEDMPVENLAKDRDSLYNVCMSSEDEVNEQELNSSDLNSTVQFQVPDIIEDKCESCSSLSECSVSCSMSEMEVQSMKAPVTKRGCFCASDVHNNNNNNKLVAHCADAELADTNPLTLYCVAETVQSSSQVKGSNKSVQSISGFPSEEQDFPVLQQGDNDVDTQVLKPDVPVFLLGADLKSGKQVEVSQNAALLCSGSSAITNPGVMNVRSALNIKSHTERTLPDSSQEMQSCSSQCNRSAETGHSLRYEMSSPGSNYTVTTDIQTTIECQFSEFDSSSKTRFLLPTKNYFSSSEPASSVESRKLNICKNCREQAVRQASKGRILPCKRVFELNTLLNNAVFKLSGNAVTAHDCSVKNLFRSASAPISFCSTRTREKKIPYLLFMSHSCGDITTAYSIQDLEVYSKNCGEKSALKQEPYTQQGSSISNAHGSVIEAPVRYKRKRKCDRKSSDRKCFTCLLL